MEQDTAAKDFETQASLHKHALSLYNSKNNKELEKLFAKYLKRSYDLSFWNLYIEYVKRVSIKKVNICDVYSFVLNHFEHSYWTFSLFREYIAELSNLDDDALKAEKIRKTYQRAFSSPMHGLSQLWGDYEKWESSVNKSTARGFIEQVQPVYNNTYSTYQRLLPFIQNDEYFKILDIEIENPLKLSKSIHTGRLNFLFNFYISKFPGTEALYFLQTFYLKDMIKVEKPQTLFLSVWFSFLYRKNFFDFDNKEFFDLICINYFNWTIKNEGIETFRLKFAEVKDRVGPHVFIYAANVEYYQGGSKETAYKVFQEVFTGHPANTLVCEEFFRLFIKIGDDDNIRSLFKKLGKTEAMWNQMIEYEFLHGDIEQYKSFILMNQEAGRKQEILPAAPFVLRKVKAEGCQGIYESVVENFGFLDLQFSTEDLLTEFLSRLPKIGTKENIFANLDTSNVIELLLMV